jgi:hypothetical protein
MTATHHRWLYTTTCGNSAVFISAPGSGLLLQVCCLKTRGFLSSARAEFDRYSRCFLGADGYSVWTMIGVVALFHLGTYCN